MPRYIDSDALIIKIQEGHKFGSLTITELISECPKADVVSKEKYDELNDRYHRLLESANILADAVRDYERREDVEIH